MTSPWTPGADRASGRGSGSGRGDCPAGLGGWFRTPLGSRAAAAEADELRDIVPGLFGYHLVQVGSGPEADILDGSPALHRVVIGQPGDDGPGPWGLVASAEALPLRSDSVDALVLCHALDLAADPHRVLREAERVLVGEGQLVIVGFNPRSVWGAVRWLRRGRDLPWCARFMAPGRVRDWLRLLGFEILQERRRVFVPPVQGAALQRRMARLEGWGRRWVPSLGAVYVLVARKHTLTLTPVKPRWRPRRALVPGLADPASRVPVDAVDP